MSNIIRTYISLLFFGCAFLYGILSYQHYSPSSYDFYINTMVFFLCSLGLGIYFLDKKIDIFLSDTIWLMLLLIFILQPVINNILYLDGLIFPIGSLLLCFAMSLFFKNINKYLSEIKVILFLSLVLIVSAFLLYITQLSHVFKIYGLVSIFGVPLQNARFSGNLIQPNQSAFVFVIGVVSSIFFFNKIKKYEILNILYIFFLSSGVALTSSRAGILMLFIVVILYCLYLCKEKFSISNFKYFFVTLLGLMFGSFIYSLSSSKDKVYDRALKAFDDPRISLLQQSYYIIRDNYLTGVGWKNFSNTNFKYYENLEWISLTDNSHFFFTQLLSEFGIFLGGGVVLFFIFILIHNFKKIKNDIYFYSLMVIFCFVFYSCFEFPLWYFRYIFIFSIFLSIYGYSGKAIYTIEKGYFISILCLILGSFSIYYLVEYRKIAYASAIVTNIQSTPKEKSLAIAGLENIFGLSYFNDLLIYQSIPIDGFMLGQTIDLGKRVTSYTPSKDFLIKQGTLLALNSQEEDALEYFKLSCKYDWWNGCKEVKNYVAEWSKLYPNKFSKILYELDIYESINHPKFSLM